jgi:hypothetical protein
VLVIFCIFFSPFLTKAQNVGEIGTPAKIENFNAHQDTVQALVHLFQRKRRSTRVRAGVVGLLLDALLIRTWTRSYDPPSKNLPPPVAAMTIVSSGSSIPTSSYVAVVVATGAAVEIVAQQRYGQKKLKALLADYDKGKPIPSRIKSKLEAKDFY